MAKTEAKTGFVNPFEPATYEVVEGITKTIPGPSLEEFIKAKGDKSVADYVKGEIVEIEGEIREITEAEVKHLEKEIANFNYNAKNKDKFLAQAQKDHFNLVMKNEKKSEY